MEIRSDSLIEYENHTAFVQGNNVVGVRSEIKYAPGIDRSSQIIVTTSGSQTDKQIPISKDVMARLHDPKDHLTIGKLSIVDGQVS